MREGVLRASRRSIQLGALGSPSGAIIRASVSTSIVLIAQSQCKMFFRRQFAPPAPNEAVPGLAKDRRASTGLAKPAMPGFATAFRATPCHACRAKPCHARPRQAPPSPAVPCRASRAKPAVPRHARPSLARPGRACRALPCQDEPNQAQPRRASPSLATAQSAAAARDIN